MFKFRVLFLLGCLALPGLPQQIKWAPVPDVTFRSGYSPEAITGSPKGDLYFSATGTDPRGGLAAELYKKGLTTSWKLVSELPFAVTPEMVSGGTIAYGFQIPYGDSLYRSMFARMANSFLRPGNINEAQIVADSVTSCDDGTGAFVLDQNRVNAFRGPFPSKTATYFSGVRYTNSTPSTSGLYRLASVTKRVCTLNEVGLLPESRYELLQVIELAENVFLAERVDNSNLARDIVMLRLDPRKKELAVTILVTTNQNLANPNPPPYVGYNCCKLVADYEARTAVISYQADRLDRVDSFLFVDSTIINKDGTINPNGIRQINGIDKSFAPVKEKIQAVSVRGNLAVFVGVSANSQGTLDTAVVFHTGINTGIRLLQTGATIGNAVVQPSDISFRRFTMVYNQAVVLLGNKLYQASIAWPPPTATITADPPKVTRGNFTTLNWEVANAWLVTLNGKAVPLKGVQTVVPEATTEFVIKAVGPDKQVESSVTVTVLEPPPPPPPPAPMPEFDVWIDQPQQAGQPATVNWWVTNATSIIIRSADGNYQALLPAVDGSTQVNLTSSQNITVLVEGKGGSLSREFWITVPEAPKPENPVPTEDKPQSPPTEPQNPPAAPPSEPEEP